MRGLGGFQHAQMRDADSRIPDLFSHIRHVIDILERILQRPHRPAEHKRATEVDTKAPAPPISPAELKLSYTIKEVCKLVGISPATIYQVLGRRELRAVKLGKKNSHLGKGPAGMVGQSAGDAVSALRCGGTPLRRIMKPSY